MNRVFLGSSLVLVALVGVSLTRWTEPSSGRRIPAASSPCAELFKALDSQSLNLSAAQVPSARRDAAIAQLRNEKWAEHPESKGTFTLKGKAQSANEHEQEALLRFRYPEGNGSVFSLEIKNVSQLRHGYVLRRFIDGKANWKNGAYWAHHLFAQEFASLLEKAGVPFLIEARLDTIWEGQGRNADSTFFQFDTSRVDPQTVLALILELPPPLGIKNSDAPVFFQAGESGALPAADKIPFGTQILKGSQESIANELIARADVAFTYRTFAEGFANSRASGLRVGIENPVAVFSVQAELQKRFEAALVAGKKKKIDMKTVFPLMSLLGLVAQGNPNRGLECLIKLFESRKSAFDLSMLLESQIVHTALDIVVSVMRERSDVTLLSRMMDFANDNADFKSTLMATDHLGSALSSVVPVLAKHSLGIYEVVLAETAAPWVDRQIKAFSNAGVNPEKISNLEQLVERWISVREVVYGLARFFKAKSQLELHSQYLELGDGLDFIFRAYSNTQPNSPFCRRIRGLLEDSRP